ncbi:hypothetical protein [Parendozoicomonas haliclonae]|uniref:Uncharacterized protein n=1 Tax=Parendozoicomonas haliclonae TaxID=1960125 RepID=A0A1X7AP19_9GAMM|nr:hypothetical protein [Parendozoicomonas haliclonae]SMA49848.1 hypothetical protein EHSB41UT_03638 [Parendozoicomonas haliclonae]
MNDFQGISPASIKTDRTGKPGQNRAESNISTVPWNTRLVKRIRTAAYLASFGTALVLTWHSHSLVSTYLLDRNANPWSYFEAGKNVFGTTALYLFINGLTDQVALGISSAVSCLLGFLPSMRSQPQVPEEFLKPPVKLTFESDPHEREEDEENITPTVTDSPTTEDVAPKPAHPMLLRDLSYEYETPEEELARSLPAQEESVRDSERFADRNLFILERIRSFNGLQLRRNQWFYHFERQNPDVLLHDDYFSMSMDQRMRYLLRMRVR